MDTRRTFAIRLTALRKEKDLTQGELADRVGISRQSVTLYERENRVPDIDVLAKIAAFFGVTADYLIGLEDARTHESADIAARTGLSGAAVEVLEAWNDDFWCETFTKADILSDIIENSAPPMTLAEYMASAFCMPVFSDTGEEAGVLRVSVNGFEPECMFWRSSDNKEFCFPLTEFECEDSLPENFRREVMEQYQAYDKLTRYGSRLDVLKIIREFYENATVAGAKLNYNRLLGVGRIEQDLTSAIIDSEEREEAERVSGYLAAMCDESLDDVTTIPIAALLDEITSGKLKDALQQIRSVRMRAIEDKKKKRQALFDAADAAIDGASSEEPTHAEEN